MRTPERDEQQWRQDGTDSSSTGCVGWDGSATPSAALCSVQGQPAAKATTGADATASTAKTLRHGRRHHHHHHHDQQLPTPTTPPSLAASGRVFDRQNTRCAPPPASPTPAPAHHAQSLRQQEPGSAKYLNRLLRLATKEASASASTDKQQRRHPSAPTPLMGDFLASFGLGSDKPAPSRSGQCASVDELSSRLRGELEQKTAPTRAEHVTLTVELRSTVQFTLSLSDTENEALGALGIGRPAPGGGEGGGGGAGDEAAATRAVSAHDALMHQSDNPTLQRTVAKHILAAVSAVDGSNWTLRDLSRGSQGWTSTYICQDSVQYWTRQNAKNPTKAVVGEYSHMEPDPTLIGRQPGYFPLNLGVVTLADQS